MANEETATSAAIGDGSDGAVQTDEQILGMTETDSTVDTEVQEPVLETEQKTEQPEELPEIQAGAPVPDWLKGLLKDQNLKAAHPEIQRLWDQHQAIRELIPTIAEARSYRETFPGGIEEAKAVAAKALELDEADTRFEQGDPQYFQELYETNPQATVQAFSHVANLIAERDPNSYREIAGSIFRNTLTSEKFDVHVDAMRQALEKDDVDTLKELSKALVGWSGKMGLTGKKEQALDPERQAFLKEREAFHKEKQEAEQSRFSEFNTKVIDGATSSVTGLIKQQLDAANLKGFTPWMRSQLENTILNEVSKTLAQDKAHGASITNIVRTQGATPQALQQIVNLKTARAKLMLKDTIRKVVSEATGAAVAQNKEKNAKENAAASRKDIAGGGSPRPTGQRPLTKKDIDYGQMSDQDILWM